MGLSVSGGPIDHRQSTGSINTVTFEALPGRAYSVRGKFVDGLGQVWVMDDRNAMVPAITAAAEK